MTYSVRVLCDSIYNGSRLTTLLMTMPRFILAEFNTHRKLSRNSASSRAIPVEKRVSMMLSEPFIPEAFGANKRGMQAGDVLDPIAQEHARDVWLRAANSAAMYAKELAQLGIHKQWANRLIEPFAWHEVVASSTEWENFLNLREHPAAQPEIQVVARLTREALASSVPVPIALGDWHMPFLMEEDLAGYFTDERLLKLSVARAARVSYLTHDTGKRDPEADVALHNMLLENRHLSPFEHCAQVVEPSDYIASNFDSPWLQYRKMIPGESIFRGAK